MHDIEPYANWQKYYNAANDPRSPYYGKSYNLEQYSDTIYGYYIDPAWDFMGSETLYIKILFTDYKAGYTIIELFGEWNDTINNDIMHLKRTIIDEQVAAGINKFILIGENVFNFHGSDDAYYEEWFDEVEDTEQRDEEGPGWIAAVSFPDFVQDELKKFQIDHYVNMGGTLQIANWRTQHPKTFFDTVDQFILRRIG
jgi:hypothetical protein